MKTSLIICDVLPGDGFATIGRFLAIWARVFCEVGAADPANPELSVWPIIVNVKVDPYAGCGMVA